MNTLGPCRRACIRPTKKCRHGVLDAYDRLGQWNKQPALAVLGSRSLLLRNATVSRLANSEQITDLGIYCHHALR